MALIPALPMAEGKFINIYTDSRYTSATVHIHGAIYRQRGLLTSAGKDIKSKEEILSLLVAIRLPKKVAIVHCAGHQEARDAVAKGNQMADLTAKQAVQGAMIWQSKSLKIIMTSVKPTLDTPRGLSSYGQIRTGKENPIRGSRDRRRKISPPTKRRAQVCYQLTLPDPLGGQETKRCG